MGEFEHDTAVRASADGCFDCHIGADWWVFSGPNGGYLAAILVRALEAQAGAEARPLRSLTVHYLRVPDVGPARVNVAVERAGRSVSFLAARLVQDGRPCAVALAVLADSRDGIELEHAEAPAVSAPEEIEQPPLRPNAPRFAGNFDLRPALGDRLFSGADEALTGGWLRLKTERQLDAASLVAFCDSWFPSIFAVTREPLAVPTLELTVHLRVSRPLPPDWVLGRFSTRTARDGFLEEDGEIYSRDGRLLAQSRQLALSL
jgi:acyl-CoA thioesterase